MNKTLIAVAVIIVVSMGVAFYWYEYRPSQIRATCEAQATEQAKEFFSEIMGNMAPKEFQEALR